MVPVCTVFGGVAVGVRACGVIVAWMEFSGGASPVGLDGIFAEWGVRGVVVVSGG